MYSELLYVGIIFVTICMFCIDMHVGIINIINNFHIVLVEFYTVLRYAYLLQHFTN